ncbi:MAG: adenylate/guanylate cyclase domain-containing protein [Microthrixaceae bacterium]
MAATTTSDPTSPEPSSDASRSGRHGDTNGRSNAARQADGLRWSIRLRLALANGIGGVIVWGYLMWLFPWNDAGLRLNETLNERIFLVYLFCVSLVSLPIQAVMMHLAVRWAEEGKPPGRFRRGLVLRLAMTLSIQNFLWWVVAGIIFAVVNGSPRVGLGIALAGLVTSTLVYLLLDRPIRPLIDLAQGGEVLTRRQRDVERRLWVFWLMGSGVPLMGVGLAVLTAPAGAAVSPWRLGVLLTVGLLAGGVVMWGAASSVGRRIERVRRAMSEVRDGRLDVRVPVDDGGDLGRLAEGFNSMTTGLQERALLQDLFGRQVGQDVADWALEHQQELGGEERSLSVLFVDLDGYTAYSESHTPHEVVEMLNRFFSAVSEVVTAHGGWINKFEGDAALCIFGAPVTQQDHAARALAVAAELPAALAALPGSPRAGVGVTTGTALAGYVGTVDRYEYTVIGDVVNVASRLCDEAKGSSMGVLVAGDVVDSSREGRVNDHSRAVLERSRFEPRGQARLRGRSQHTEVFELLPDDGFVGRRRVDLTR